MDPSTPTGLALLDAEVTRQASLIAYHGSATDAESAFGCDDLLSDAMRSGIGEDLDTSTDSQQAVPPTEAHVWSLSALEATVLETLELARLRLVDGQALGAVPAGPPPPGPSPPRLGQYLPAIYLASAPAADTVTTDLGRVAAPASG